MVIVNKIKTKVNLNKLKFNNSKKIGEGFFGSVYNLHNNKKTNKKYVIKKIKQDFTKKIFTFLVFGKSQKKIFDKEIYALTKLSKLGLAPKIYHYDEENLTYIIQKLDYNLNTMLKNNMIKPYHLDRLIELFKKMQKTNIKHNDLHSANIMYSKSTNKFYIIDLGIYKIFNSCENGKMQKICYKYTENDAMVLGDLFYYLRKKIKREKTKKIKNQYLDRIKKLVKLFHIESDDMINYIFK